MRWGELEKRRKPHARNGLTKTEWQREHRNVFLSFRLQQKSLEFLGSAFINCDSLAEINIPDDAAYIVKNTDKSADDFQKYSKVAKLKPLLTFRKKIKGIKSKSSLREDFYKELESCQPHHVYILATLLCNLS